MVLHSHLPGQETGNIDYVVESGVGLWAPGPGRTAEAVQWWLSNPDALTKAEKACKAIANPQAADDIAERIMEYVQ
jgi:1,2-diacylglycerol 3-beta-galactosyltransferase